MTRWGNGVREGAGVQRGDRAQTTASQTMCTEIINISAARCYDVHRKNTTGKTRHHAIKESNRDCSNAHNLRIMPRDTTSEHDNDYHAH